MKYTAGQIRELAQAAQSNPERMEELRRVVKHGRMLLASNPRSLWWRRIADAALLAAMRGSLPAVKSFVGLGIAPDEVLPANFWESTLLHHATHAERPEVLSYLVSLRPNLDVLDGRGRTPLHTLADSSPIRYDNAKVLARGGANLSIEDPERTSFGSTTRSKEFRDSLRPLQQFTVVAEGAPNHNRSMSLEIFAVGVTIETALNALGQGLGWGTIEGVELQPNEPNPPSAWYVRFTADGTSMKAAGQYVRGGVVVTWWK